MTKKALGRGLKALIPDAPAARPGYAELPLGRLVPNPNQPRARFDEEALASLADSIREHGLLQPLLVTDAGADGFMILAGERRFRAARRAGLERVPVVIRERLDERAELEIALVENLQRRDLTPLEEARAYEHLRTQHGLSQAEIAERVGIDRSTVANSMRLLKLAPETQELVEAGTLSAGHARALLAFPEDERHAQAETAVREALSVRQVEQAAADRRRKEDPAPPRATPKPAQDPNLRDAEEQLSERLGVPVSIRTTARGGSITIRCPDGDALMRVFDVMIGGE
jgi:ParB family chromosome partitioning protein